MKTEEKKYLLVINDCVDGEYNDLEEVIEDAEYCYAKNNYSKVEVDNITDGWVEWINGRKQL